MMDKKALIEQLENALSYSEHFPGGKWEIDLLKEAVAATIKYLEETHYG